MTADPTTPVRDGSADLAAGAASRRHEVDPVRGGPASLAAGAAASRRHEVDAVRGW